VVHDLAPTGCMTFDLHVTFDLDTEVKNAISIKTPLLLQTMCDGNMGWSCDLTFVDTYCVLTAKRSKVIKGSFPILS
jgi:hypothetical protein